jgi:glycerophosphoryl diester phosphodiesterase
VRDAALITHSLPLQDLYRRKPLVLAHRGASYDAPENTLAAFRLAREMGADGVELDVLLSADDIPVVIHDFTVDKTTDGEGKVRDKTLRELKKLDAGSHFDYTFRSERIPTLDEALEATGDLIVNIELKSVGLRPSPLEMATLAVIRRRNLQNRVIISSFNPFALRRFHRLAPNIPLGFLYAPDSPAWLKIFMIGLPHEARHPYHGMIDAEFMKRTHANRYRVNTWTVDDPARAAVLRDLEVDAIITNRPDVMLQMLGRSSTETRKLRS